MFSNPARQMPYISNFRGLLFYDHPSKAGALFCVACGEDEGRVGNVLCLAGGLREEDFLSGLLFGLLFGKLFLGKRGRAAVRAA